MIKFLRQRKVELLFKYKLLNKFWSFDWDLDGRNKSVVTYKFESERRDESKLLAQLDSSDDKYAEATTKTF